MSYTKSSRRQALKQLASVSALGVLGSLRSISLIARESNTPSAGLIPGLKGKVVQRRDEDYEIWRQSMVWHHSKPDRYPDIIIQPKSEQDVITAVNFAAKNHHKIAIKSGGHNASGPCLRNGGVLIDLSTMTDIQINEIKRIASIQTGVRSLQLVTALRDKRLCFPVPHCPSVGLGGFTMGGGIGWNYPHRGGMACYSIDSAEIVLANGERVLATADQNQDLLWAVRGAGPGFFGVVTRLHLSLYPVPKTIMASSYIHSLDDLSNVTAALDGLMEITDDRVEVIAILLHNPDAPPELPAEKSKICFVTAFAFADSVEAAETMLAPYAGSALAKQTLAKDENQVFSFEGLYDKFFSLEVPAGRMARYAVDNVMTDEPGKAMHALADHFRTAPSPHAHVLAGYGMNLKPRDDACFSSIAKSYFGCYAIWDKEENDDLNFKWLDQTLPLMDPFAKGHYVNEVDSRLHPERVQQCFSSANWKRLQQLRAKYDPDGVFHSYLGYS